MDAHDREYLAAAEGMADLYGRRLEPDAACTLPSIGDRVTWRTKAMTETQFDAGRVVRVTAAQAGGHPELIAEAESDGVLYVLDPRPWPAGNLLPF